MNIELYEGQSCNVYLNLEGEFEVYGGTKNSQFSASKTESGEYKITVPPHYQSTCSSVRYEVFAKRVSDNKEWLVLSGKIYVRTRYSDTEGGMSPLEYHVTKTITEDGIEVDGGTMIVGVRGEKGERGVDGLSAYDIARQNGFEGSYQEFTNMMICVQMHAEMAQKASEDAVDAQILSEIAAVNALASKQGAENIASDIVTTHAQDASLHVSAESIQSVVPIAWSGQGSATTAGTGDSYAFGAGAKSNGSYAFVGGCNSQASAYSVAIGGRNAIGGKSRTVTIGSYFSDTEGGNTCTTEGTGSITIGAGANTKNNGDVESSNSVTIGCKALNQGADSVVIGAQAKNVNDTGANVPSSIVIGANARSGSPNNVIIGVGAESMAGNNLVLGKTAKSWIHGVALGFGANAGQKKLKAHCIALGYNASAVEERSIAIGSQATVSDYGATVIRSTAEDGTYTQLYFSGANTPLANTYENGAPMLGYVTMQKNAEGKYEPVAAGTRSLIELLTNNSTFSPASLDENGEWVAPKVFHPSDLDLPVEEPAEEEEYQPLPVYPIVEPEIEEETT